MKTKNLLIILGAVGFAAITMNATANDTLLSPRAAGNQITKVAGINADPNLVITTGYAVSPRAAGNRITRVAGMHNDVNPALACAKHMTGSPKAIQACAENPLAPMPCCAVTTAN